MEKIWEDVAASETRIRMMDRLVQNKVGFNDIEHFNLGLIFNSKTLNYDNYADKDDRKVVEAAMRFKRKDEIRNRRAVIREKLKVRKDIEEQLRQKNSQRKRLMKHLNMRAMENKRELDKKYEDKVEHLKRKYAVDKNRELDKVPPEMEEYGDLAVFNAEEFENIEIAKIEAVKYGEIEIDGEEEAALRLHPKMALPRRLEEGYMNLALDMSYTKVRWQLKKEEEERNKGEKRDMSEKEKEI